MKKNKFITLVSSVIALATVSFTAIAAHAADDSIVLKLNDATIETSKVVDVYYEGETATQFDCIEMEIAVDGITPSKVEMSSSFGTSLADYVDGNILATLVNVSPIEVKDNKFLIGTLTIPVEAGAGEFTLEVTYFTDCDVLDSDEGTINLGSLTIPGAKPEGPTTVPFEGVTATYLDTYKDDANALPVAAWYATIDWSQYDAVKALNWELTVNDETKTVAESSGVEVSGKPTIVYGLAIAGQATQLETIDVNSVVLK